MVLGTRPEVVKLALVIRKLKRAFGSQLQIITCNTGQHKELIETTLRSFADMTVDVSFDIMTENQRLGDTAGRMLSSLDNLIATTRPSLVLVQGDTLTAFVASVAAFFNKIGCGHVEAGLRTWDLQNPFPEEFNRKVVGTISRLSFAVSPLSASALRTEGADPSTVHVVGNPVIDAVLDILSREPPLLAKSILSSRRGGGRQLVLLTAHRRESFGAPIRAIFEAVKELTTKFEDLDILFPVHPNPQVKKPAYEILSGLSRVHLLDPLPYEDLVHIMKKCTLILTDSGGIQEEASVFGVPVLVMRRVTERMEGVQAGVALLIGVQKEKIVKAVSSLVSGTSDARAKLRSMSRKVFPYGDGLASDRIVDVIATYLKLKATDADVDLIREHCPEKSTTEIASVQRLWRQIRRVVYPRKREVVKLLFHGKKHRACLQRISQSRVPGLLFVDRWQNVTSDNVVVFSGDDALN